MVSWWVPYPAKGPKPDFNNCPKDDLNSGCTLAPQCLFECDSNNAPPPHPQAIPILCQMESHLFRSPTYGFLAGSISGQRAAGLTSIMAWEVTQIVPPILAPQRSFESDSINGPSPGQFELRSYGRYTCSGLPINGLLVGAISSQGPQA